MRLITEEGKQSTKTLQNKTGSRLKSRSEKSILKRKVDQKSQWELDIETLNTQCEKPRNSLKLQQNLFNRIRSNNDYRISR